MTQFAITIGKSSERRVPFAVARCRRGRRAHEAQFKTFKETAPGFVDRLRVLTPALIHRFESVEIGAGGGGALTHGWLVPKSNRLPLSYCVSLSRKRQGFQAA